MDADGTIDEKLLAAQRLMPAKSEPSSVDPYAAVADLNEERRITGQIKSQIELNRSLQHSQKSSQKKKTPIAGVRRGDSIKSRKSTLSSKSGRSGKSKRGASAKGRGAFGKNKASITSAALSRKTGSQLNVEEPEPMNIVT